MSVCRRGPIAFVSPFVVAALGACSSSSTPGIPLVDGGAPLDSAGIVDAAGDVFDASPDVEAGFAEATHSPLPQVLNLGGPVVASPVIVPVVSPDDPDATQITSYLTSLVGSSWWSGSLAMYGVGAATVGTAIDPGWSDATMLADADARQVLRTLYTQAQTSGTPIAWSQNVYVFFTPPNVTVTAPLASGTDVQLCSATGGYHSFIQLDANTRAAYAVIPRCTSFLGLSGFDAVTGISSHEIAEASSDPFETDIDPNETGNATPAWALPDELAWNVAFGGGEIADLCANNSGAFTMDPSVGAVVQHLWSNEAALAGHDPCGISSAYFNTAPVLPKISLGVKSVPTTPGLLLAAGQSKTIELDLFSDAPTADWTLDALDLSVALGEESTSTLTLALDKTSGHNAEKVNLTITVNSQGQLSGATGLEGVLLVSQLGSATTFWPIVILSR